MNCANHPDRERAAFCQNCGKPLCAECTRTVGTSTFCEPCLAARVHAPAQPAGYPYSAAGRPPGQPVPPPPPSEPSPGLAALLGLIPGVGAMYNEQYGKGIVHLIMFALLVSLSHDVGIFGLFVFGWICYMVVEAYHTARARRDGTPLPNPFGLNEISERLGFGRAWPGAGPVPPAYGAPPNPHTGAAAPPAAAVDPNVPNVPNVPPASPTPPPYSYGYAPPAAQWAVPPVPPVPPLPPIPDPDLHYHRRLPAGAIWLIVLGVFFLVGNLGFFHIVPGRLFGPLIFIGLGVWIFVHKMTSTGQGLENDGTPEYRWRLGRALNGAIWFFLLGVIWLLDALHILRWSTSWPLIFIAGGILLLLRRTLYEYGMGRPPYPGAIGPAAPAPSTELAPRPPAHDEPGNESGSQEGR